MRNRRVIIAGIGIMLLLGSIAQVMAAGINFKSKKPMYAAVALNEKGDKILKLAFDESQGTGKGYDTLYADTNFNGKLSDDKPIKGRITTHRDYTYATFPQIKVSVPYNNKAVGIKEPCTLNVRYSVINNKGKTVRSFSVSETIKLRDRSGEWEYLLYNRLNTSDITGKVRTTILGGKPGIDVIAKPEKGQLGIGAGLTVGKQPAQYTVMGEQTKFHLEIKNQKGKIVHSENIDVHKLVPG